MWLPKPELIPAFSRDADSCLESRAIWTGLDIDGLRRSIQCTSHQSPLIWRLNIASTTVFAVFASDLSL
jgi:hypothetical protein